MNTTISSPSNTIEVEFYLSKDSIPHYLVKHKNNIAIDSSSMGFEFKDQAPLQKGLKLIGVETNTQNETWEMPWGEQRSVRNNYNQLIVKLQEEKAPHRKFNIHFKVYDDGLGFRYEFLEQEGV
ncbi:MAG: glycoside hydrolase family 97 N-terminal domain-containing protein, partial [Flavobacteriaceae bacterium]|nr:glycoside hydrolase family 97 N-terminal domain-containing protein [Flavobacteriaceae bacterium]